MKHAQKEERERARHEVRKRVHLAATTLETKERKEGRKRAVGGKRFKEEMKKG